MRITIDIEPTMTVANLAGPGSTQVGAVAQEKSQPLVQDIALSAGASVNTGFEGRSSALPPQNTSAGISAGAGTATSSLHANSFGLATSTGLSEGIMSAGLAKG